MLREHELIAPMRSEVNRNSALADRDVRALLCPRVPYDLAQLLLHFISVETLRPRVLGHGSLDSYSSVAPHPALSVALLVVSELFQLRTRVIGCLLQLHELSGPTAQVQRGVGGSCGLSRGRLLPGGCRLGRDPGLGEVQAGGRGARGGEGRLAGRPGPADLVLHVRSTVRCVGCMRAGG